jgi:hypothetical protein
MRLAENLRVQLTGANEFSEEHGELAVKSKPSKLAGADGGTESAGCARTGRTASPNRPAFSGWAGGTAQQQHAPADFAIQHDRFDLAGAGEQQEWDSAFDTGRAPGKIGAQVNAAGNVAVSSVAECQTREQSSDRRRPDHSG